MKALSIQQPWAWLIVNGYKDIENRSWYTSFRGMALVHAGKKFDREGAEYIRGRFPYIHLPPTFDLGGIVGRVEIVTCVNKSDSEWFFPPWGLELRHAKPLPFFPLRGQLGFFEVGEQLPERET